MSTLTHPAARPTSPRETPAHDHSTHHHDPAPIRDDITSAAVALLLMIGALAGAAVFVTWILSSLVRGFLG